MDRFLKMARECKWNENDVKKAVIILKNCGIDVANIGDIFSQSGIYIAYFKPNDGLKRENIYITLIAQKQEKLKKFLYCQTILQK